MSNMSQVARGAMRCGEDPVLALHDYMSEKDSWASFAWCERFVAREIKEIRLEEATEIEGE